MRLKKYTEENGARAAVLKQAVYYPKEGLDYEAFLKVLLPPQQAIGRKLLQEGFLVRTEEGNIVLSPILREELRWSPDWDENIHAFLARLVTSLAEAVVDFKKANRWAEQARTNPEQLRMLVFQHSRSNLPPFQQRLAQEALSLFQKGQTLMILPHAKREFLVSATIAIELYKNTQHLKQEAARIVPTLENLLEQTEGIPINNLCSALDWMSELYLELEYEDADRYVERWRLADAATHPAFEPVFRGLAALYSPLAGDQSVGEMLQRWKERK